MPTIEEIETALKMAEAAHAQFEKNVLRGKRDADWAKWYARYIHRLFNTPKVG